MKLYKKIEVKENETDFLGIKYIKVKGERECNDGKTARLLKKSILEYLDWK